MGIFTSGQTLTAAQLNALANTAFTSTTGLSGSTTTTSASYVDMATGSTISGFAKLHADTSLLVFMRKNMYSTVNNTIAMLGVNINSTDYDLDNPAITEANSWQPSNGFTRITGLAAGTYTIQGRWKRTSGTGTLTSGSWFSLLVMEAQ